MTCFDFFQQGGKAGTVEIRTRITIVIKMANISQPFLTGIFFEVFFLRRDLSRYVFAKECAICRFVKHIGQ